jgi:hypothetical protein
MYRYAGAATTKRIRIRDEQPGSYYRELRNHFFWVKIIEFFDANPGWKKFGFGIRDNISDLLLKG